MWRAYLLVGVLAPVWSIPAAAMAQYVLFDEPTDSISVPGHTSVESTMTIEARFRMLSSLPSFVHGRLFSEQRDSVADKKLGSGPEGLSGGAWTGAAGGMNDPGIEAGLPVPKDAWHYAAFVRDGHFQRLYLDGSLVQTRDLSTTVYDGPIANSGESVMSIGAIVYPGGNQFFPAFLGLLDWIRVSSDARYSGDIVAPLTTVPTPDAATLLLYDFNEPAASLVVHDQGANHWDGMLGTGFQGATPPELVPEPSSAVMFLLAAGLTIVARRARSVG